MKNSDSTSGNAQEQLPKFLLILSLWDFFFGKLGSHTSVDLLTLAIFYLFMLVLCMHSSSQSIRLETKNVYAALQGIIFRSQRKPF